MIVQLYMFQRKNHLSVSMKEKKVRDEILHKKIKDPKWLKIRSSFVSFHID